MKKKFTSQINFIPYISLNMICDDMPFNIILICNKTVWYYAEINQILVYKIRTRNNEKNYYHNYRHYKCANLQLKIRNIVKTCTLGARWFKLIVQVQLNYAPTLYLSQVVVGTIKLA